MVDIQKLEILRKLVDDPKADENLLSIYLDNAKHIVLEKMFPFGLPHENVEVPKQHEYTQLEIAAYLYLKRGAEGEITHTEDTITRTYESADVPNSLLNRITSYAGLF